MSQQLVLIPKVKYDYLLSKSVMCENSNYQTCKEQSKRSPQLSFDKQKNNSEQRGEGMDIKKKLYVHNTNIVFGKKNNKKTQQTHNVVSTLIQR